jgi:hypothetical protein
MATLETEADEVRWSLADLYDHPDDLKEDLAEVDAHA